MQKNNVDPLEILKFSEPGWWHDNNLYQLLHQMNPARLEFIYKILNHHWQQAQNTKRKLLDVGCGGGILTLPLARMKLSNGSHQLFGIDLSHNAIIEAQKASKQAGLNINFRHIALEVIADEYYDAVFCLEIIEHIDDYETFLKQVANNLKTGGVLFISTLQRNLMSKLLGIHLAENILNLLPRGTHQWEKFRNPSEIMTVLHQAGLDYCDLAQIIFNPIQGNFYLSKNSKMSYCAPNYILAAIKQ